MPRPSDEDLFQSSTMTFGEHLEELRVCLIRGALGLAIAVLIGFYVARPVVHMIEEPLRRALGKYYSERAIETFDTWQPRQAGGPPLPYSRDEIIDAVERHGMSFELREVHPDRLRRVLDPVASDTMVLPSPRPADLPLRPAKCSATPASPPCPPSPWSPGSAPPPSPAAAGPWRAIAICYWAMPLATSNRSRAKAWAGP